MANLRIEFYQAGPASPAAGIPVYARLLAAANLAVTATATANGDQIAVPTGFSGVVAKIKAVGGQCYASIGAVGGNAAAGAEPRMHLADGEAVEIVVAEGQKIGCVEAAL